MPDSAGRVHPRWASLMDSSGASILYHHNFCTLTVAKAGRVALAINQERTGRRSDAFASREETVFVGRRNRETARAMSRDEV